MRSIHWSWLVLVAILCLGLVGCGGAKKVTDEDFKKIKTGMSEKEVTDALGTPTESKEVDGGPLGKMKNMVWKGDKTYYVVIMDGKVTMSGQGEPPKQ